MGTISVRERKDKSIGYTAQIRLKRDGRVVYTEAKTFDRRQAAAAWIVKREKELARPGGIEAAAVVDPLFSEVIKKYVDESIKKIGRTKAQVLNAVARAPIGEKRCSQLGSTDYVDFAKSLDVLPQTASNYMSHIGAVVNVARPAWGYPLSEQALRDARRVLSHLGHTAKSAKRERRASFAELDLLLEHFVGIRKRHPKSAPMQYIVPFAIFSTRRQEEIVTIKWSNLDAEGSRILVRDMKHPGQKIGNDIWCDLPPEAMRILSAIPRREGEDRIFPYTTDAVGAAFTRACRFLQIQDLRFHDLRHEGTSWLFEQGLSIPRVAAVTGHRSWASLKRYTHIREMGNRFSGWLWLARLAPTQNTVISGHPSIAVHVTQS
ncbi:integrase/recombinase [Pandoraea anapnoica]|uniref:Integrase/recombinase n=1 Tax=Pandoraea anapnoica TaxID=2508301 RepID=A0A5E5A2C7_9BURK|nr:site-specific integrase [Pandoraea anapnoica]VVE67769.1 integrase/recombinase [Pandoraea anapnoica]